jgi:Holliday junction resolvase RusA-like endonuclease
VSGQTIAFHVDGTPAPQGSKRAYMPRGGSRAVVVDDNAKPLRAWRQAVTHAAREARGNRPPMLGPVRVDITFYLSRPVSHYRTGKRSQELRDSAPRIPANGPDLDKLVRGVLDALTAAGVFEDDRQVQALGAGKRFTRRRAILPWDVNPGALIRVSPR